LEIVRLARGGLKGQECRLVEILVKLIGKRLLNDVANNIYVAILLIEKTSFLLLGLGFHFQSVNSGNVYGAVL